MIILCLFVLFAVYAPLVILGVPHAILQTWAIEEHLDKLESKMR